MKKILILFLCLSSAGVCRAQLTLDECRRMAREHYPEIRQYELIRQTSQYTLSNVARSWLPQFSLSAQATWQTAVANFPDEFRKMFAAQNLQMEGLHKDQYKVALELNQTIWDGGASHADRRIAEADEAQSLRSADVDMYALEGRVDDLFFGILLLDEQIKQVRLTQALLESNLDKMRSLLRNGVAEPSDVDAVEAQLLTVRQQETQAGVSFVCYRQMLGVFIGQELGDRTLTRPEAVELVEGDPERPEQALFDAQSAKLSAQEASVKAATHPRFGFFAQGYYGYPGFNMFDDMFNNRWSWNAMLGVKMSWNFGAYYTRSNSLKKLRTAQRQVEVQRDIFLFNTRLQFMQESGDFVSLDKALAEDDRIVQLRRSVREAAESKLRNGVIDTNDLLQKITDESQAMMNRSAREVELLKTIYEQKHTLNR